MENNIVMNANKNTCGEPVIRSQYPQLRTLDDLNNPIFWSNNKRKLHGLPLRRKIKQKDIFEYYKSDLFNLIEAEMEKQIEEAVIKSVDKFVDIKNINAGEKI